MRIESVSPGPERHVAARSTLYGHLSGWLGFPWQEFHEAALARELAPAASECAGALPYAIDQLDELLASLDEVEPRYDEFQSAYVRLFDVGPGAPPCPLSGGLWVGDRQKTMEEALRFYRFFGLTTSSDGQQLPDHVTTELEFLHFLTFSELGALREGTDHTRFRRASRDFLLRHSARWLPMVSKKLSELDAPAFWHGLVGLATTYCEADAAHLVATEGPISS